jgi:hypothetical protein
MSANLDQFSELTRFDYAFLKGDKEAYPEKGASYAIVEEWCRNQHLGEFGKPTKKGIVAMNEYRRKRSI